MQEHTETLRGFKKASEGDIKINLLCRNEIEECSVDSSFCAFLTFPCVRILYTPYPCLSPLSYIYRCSYLRLLSSLLFRLSLLSELCHRHRTWPLTKEDMWLRKDVARKLGSIFIDLQRAKGWPLGCLHFLPLSLFHATLSSFVCHLFLCCLCHFNSILFFFLPDHRYKPLVEFVSFHYFP